VFILKVCYILLKGVNMVQLSFKR